MAGSYNHVVEDDGSLLPNTAPFGIGMLENGGDVFEAVEEMYGMIWFLADELSHCYPHNMNEDGVPGLVEEARQNYREGLKKSPTKRYKKESDE